MPRPIRRGTKLVGYRYTMTLTHLRCIAGANELLLTLAGRKLAVRCRRSGLRAIGVLAPAKRYLIRGAAVHLRARGVARLGLAYVLFLAPRAE